MKLKKKKMWNFSQLNYFQEEIELESSEILQNFSLALKNYDFQYDCIKQTSNWCNQNVIRNFFKKATIQNAWSTKMKNLEWKMRSREI